MSTNYPNYISRGMAIRNGPIRAARPVGQTCRSMSGASNTPASLAKTPAVFFAQVFTSPLQRASQTCALAGFGKVAEVNSDLVEWDYGRFEGKTIVEIRRIGRAGNYFATAVLAANHRRTWLSVRIALSRRCSPQTEMSWRFPAATSSE